MKSLIAVLAVVILAVAGCSRAGGPAPVEYRGVGAGETRPGMATAAARDSAGSVQGAYIPPAGYARPEPGGNGIIAQELPPPATSGGEPNDSYTQAIGNRPVQETISPSPFSSSPPPYAQANTPPSPSPEPPATPAAAASAAALGDGSFGWPLRGRLISGYGPKSGGQANDGLNIAAPFGTPVYASKNGTVAYAGNELRGFGNMVLIRHTGGMFTVYAHLDRIGVNKDQDITKGQPVGTVGQSGGVNEPQLHFEIRRGSTPLDPGKYLGR